jgi:hypothetical protein
MCQLPVGRRELPASPFGARGVQATRPVSIRLLHCSGGAAKPFRKALLFAPRARSPQARAHAGVYPSTASGGGAARPHSPQRAQPSGAWPLARAWHASAAAPEKRRPQPRASHTSVRLPAAAATPSGCDAAACMRQGAHGNCVSMQAASVLAEEVGRIAHALGDWVRASNPSLSPEIGSSAWLPNEAQSPVVHAT